MAVSFEGVIVFRQRSTQAVADDKVLSWFSVDLDSTAKAVHVNLSERATSILLSFLSKS